MSVARQVLENCEVHVHQKAVLRLVERLLPTSALCQQSVDDNIGEALERLASEWT